MTPGNPPSTATSRKTILENADLLVRLVSELRTKSTAPKAAFVKVTATEEQKKAAQAVLSRWWEESLKLNDDALDCCDSLLAWAGTGLGTGIREWMKRCETPHGREHNPLDDSLLATVIEEAQAIARLAANASNMADVIPARLDPTFLQLVQEAAARAYNRKAVFRNFLRRCGVPGTMLAGCSDQETKRAWLDRILPELEETEAGQRVITTLADALIAHSEFPDLANYEDSKLRVEAARGAVNALAEYKRKQSEARQDDREAAKRRADGEKVRQSAIARQQSLANLRARLDALSTRLGEQAAGYEFETWFYDLADFAEVDCRRPYKAGGRQIDGSLTVDGTTYLVELRFKTEQMGTPDLDGILSRINTKADNTMGLFVSISGYNSGAKTASFARTPLLLVDFSHLYHILSGAMSLDEVVRRVRRHASQTGESFLEVNRFEAP